DRYELGVCGGPGSAVHRSARATRCTASGTHCLDSPYRVPVLFLAAGRRVPVLAAAGFLALALMLARSASIRLITRGAAGSSPMGSTGQPPWLLRNSSVSAVS